jgi:hypothetical protein
MRRQLALHIPPPPPGEPSLQAERLMQRIERMLTDRRAERLRAQRQREEVNTVIRDIELLDIHDDLSELLEKVPPTNQTGGFIPKLLTACLSFARAIDRLQERESINTQDTRQEVRHVREELHHEIQSLRADLAAVQALITR